MAFSGMKKLSVLIAVGIIMMIVGAVMVKLWPSLYSSILEKELVLTNTSRSFPDWKKLPISIYTSFYFFNCTNPHDVIMNHSKPELEELGPYVFREYREKVKIQWNSNNTVTYKEKKTWIYDPHKTNGSLDDVITTLNVPAIVAALINRNKFNASYILNVIFRLFKEELFVSKNVKEFLFVGYSDPLFTISEILNITMIPYDKFGWFYGRNGTDYSNGVYNMYTGTDHITKLWTIYSWNYTAKTTYYESYCGFVNGSAGEFWPPHQEKDNISFYSPDICRTLTLSYKEEELKEGVTGYKYTSDENIFANKSTCPKNWCFCPNGKCIPSGVLNITSCRYGIPVFISLPHFYLADPSYRESVIGMKPEKDKHEFFINLDHVTGFPLTLRARFQINILLQPITGISIFENVSMTYFPMVWFSESADIDENTLGKLKWISKYPVIGFITFYCLTGLGIAINIIAFVICISLYCKKIKEDEVKLLYEETEETN